MNPKSSSLKFKLNINFNFTFYLFWIDFDFNWFQISLDFIFDMFHFTRFRFNSVSISPDFTFSTRILLVETLVWTLFEVNLLFSAPNFTLNWNNIWKLLLVLIGFYLNFNLLVDLCSPEIFPVKDVITSTCFQEYSKYEHNLKLSYKYTDLLVKNDSFLHSL